MFVVGELGIWKRGEHAYCRDAGLITGGGFSYEVGLSCQYVDEMWCEAVSRRILRAEHVRDPRHCGSRYQTLQCGEAGHSGLLALLAGHWSILRMLQGFMKPFCGQRNGKSTGYEEVRRP